MAEAVARPHLTALPTLFPLDFEESERRLNCLQLSENEFRAASFLDERMLQGRASHFVEMEEAERLAASLAGESDFIFHIGHVGSTLVSRLLGASERVFALREPAILRTLARRKDRGQHVAVTRQAVDPDLDMTLKLLSRVWRAEQRSLVKATSFVAEIAPAILAASPAAKALLMFDSPQVSIAGRLAGPASRAELPSVAAGWLHRLHHRLGGVFWRLEALSEGERAALGWACEISALASAADRFPARTQWLEFESFLADPAAGLGRALDFLRGGVLDGEIDAMLAGRDLGRYSKAPQFAYDTKVRHQIIGQGLREHAIEIERGVAWLNAAGAAHPIIAAAAKAAVAGRRAAERA